MRRRGFTLLELLLAMTMSATIAGTLAASVYIAYRARNSAQRAVESSRVLRTVGEVIRQDLENALPPTGVLAGTFAGNPDSLNFFCTGADRKAVVQGDCRQIEYAVASDPDGRNALVRRANTNLLAPVQEVPPDEPICRNVVAFSLSYYDGLIWSDTWDSTQRNNLLPLAVQMTLAFIPDRHRDDGGGDQIEIVRTFNLPCAAMDEALTTGMGGGL